MSFNSFLDICFYYRSRLRRTEKGRQKTNTHTHTHDELVWSMKIYLFPPKWFSHISLFFSDTIKRAIIFAWHFYRLLRGVLISRQSLKYFLFSTLSLLLFCFVFFFYSLPIHFPFLCRILLTSLCPPLLAAGVCGNASKRK